MGSRPGKFQVLGRSREENWPKNHSETVSKLKGGLGIELCPHVHKVTGSMSALYSVLGEPLKLIL